MSGGGRRWIFFGWCEMVISAFLGGDGWWWVYFG